MKTFAILLMVITTTMATYAQTVEDVDFVSPEHEGFVSIKKGNQWAFMRTNGDIAVPFRRDLVISSETESQMPYPYFKNGRAIVAETQGDITFYGYIDTEGRKVVPSKYISITPFNSNGKAIVLELFKEIIGENSIINKPMVRYEYSEIIIDSVGNPVYYIKERKHIIPAKNTKNNSYKITSYFVSSELIAVRNENGSWDLIDITKD